MTMAPNTPGVEGNNFIITWALTACLGNIQAVSDMEMWQQEREKRVCSIISLCIQNTIFTVHFKHFAWKNTINVSFS